MSPIGSSSYFALPAAPVIGTFINTVSLGLTYSTLLWTTGAGAGISSYQVNYYSSIDNTLQATYNVPVSPLSNVNFFTNGVPLYAKVSAVNDTGAGPLSAASATRTMSPAAPVLGPLVAGVGGVTASWTTPLDGGSAIILYELYIRRVSDDVAVAVGSPSFPATSQFNACAAGVPVYAEINAYNSNGYSLLSLPSNSVTPT